MSLVIKPCKLHPDTLRLLRFARKLWGLHTWLTPVSSLLIYLSKAAQGRSVHRSQQIQPSTESIGPYAYASNPLQDTTRSRVCHPVTHPQSHRMMRMVRGTAWKGLHWCCRSTSCSKAPRCSFVESEHSHALSQHGSHALWRGLRAGFGLRHLSRAWPRRRDGCEEWDGFRAQAVLPKERIHFLLRPSAPGKRRATIHRHLYNVSAAVHLETGPALQSRLMQQTTTRNSSPHNATHR